VDRVRKRVAESLGVREDEIALTRNATEALQALIGGYNRLRPGVAAGACVRVTPALFTSEADVLTLRSALKEMASIP